MLYFPPNLQTKDKRKNVSFTEVLVTAAFIEDISKKYIWPVLPPVYSYLDKVTKESGTNDWKKILAMLITEAGGIEYMSRFCKLT